MVVRLTLLHFAQLNNAAQGRDISLRTLFGVFEAAEELIDREVIHLLIFAGSRLPSSFRSRYVRVYLRSPCTSGLLYLRSPSTTASCRSIPTSHSIAFTACLLLIFGVTRLTRISLHYSTLEALSPFFSIKFVSGRIRILSSQGLLSLARGGPFDRRAGRTGQRISLSIACPIVS